jgi:uncharacterized protein
MPKLRTRNRDEYRFDAAAGGSRSHALGKLILIVLAFALAWWVLRNYRRSMAREEPPAGAAEDMVRCAHCGVHLPRSESHPGGGSFFCSEEHLRLHG